MGHRRKQQQRRQGEVLWYRLPVAEIPAECSELLLWVAEKYDQATASGHLLLIKQAGWHYPWVALVDLNNGWVDYVTGVDLKHALLRASIHLDGGDCAASFPMKDYPHQLQGDVWALALPTLD